MNIKRIANNLIKKYRTSDPIELAGELGITIMYRNLGTVNGFYVSVDNYKFININSQLNNRRKTITAAHELGHAVLHPDFCAPFMTEHTYFSINKYEIEANTFAINLLITDEELFDCQCSMGYTINQIASLHGLPPELVELKLNGMR